MAKKKIIETEEVKAVEVNEEVDTIVENISEIIPEDISEEVGVSEEEAYIDARDDDDYEASDINIPEMKYIDDIGFSVVKFLNAEQIETIADFVNQYTTWTDRYYAKAIITLNIATDLTEEEVSSIVADIDMIMKPFIFTVYDNIVNWDFVEQAIEYYDSFAFKATKFATLLNIAADTINTEVEEQEKNAVKDIVKSMRE